MRRLLPSICLALGLLGLSTRPACAEGPERAVTYDRNAYPPSSARTTLLLGGFASTAVWYGGSLGVSSLWPEAPGALDLRVPVVGPWMALGDTGCGSSPDCSDLWVVIRATLTVLDGIGQTGGVLVMAEGLFLPTAEPTSRELPRLKRTSQAPSWHVVPSVAKSNAVGFAVVGSF
jgi:hypothetical protein